MLESTTECHTHPVRACFPRLGRALGARFLEETFVRNCTLILGLGFVVVVGGVRSVSAQSKSPEPAKKADLTRKPTVLEERPEFIKPARAPKRSRIGSKPRRCSPPRKKQETDPAEALRLCQRAYRRDPGRGAILLEIIVLAKALEKASVIDNYAEAALASNPQSPAVLALLSDRFNKRGFRVVVRCHRTTAGFGERAG